MKNYIYIIIALLGFVSCNNEMETSPDDCNPIPLRGIRAVIDNGSSTRAVAPLVDSIGKYSFLNTDEIIFTKIQRTKRPIPGFSYAGVRYSCTVEGSGDKQNVSWKRNNPQEDIFWSDGSEPHTFIGYILPHNDNETATASGYDWNHIDNQEVYYGSIGDPTNASEVIDYTATPATGAGESRPYDLEKLRKEDLLLTYDTNMQNEDAMAQVHFHHGLASIRVVVTITGFSSTGTDPDAQTLVTNMQVHKLPTMYKWDGNSYKTDPLTSEDQSALDGFTWNGTKPTWDQKKNMNLWQSREWRGSGASRTFTFYGIVVPSEQDKVEMTFTVTYPDPLNPSGTLTKPYTATLELPNSKKVEFRPGFCTNININLNHKDEKMTVGAEYMSWQNEPAPNQGSLRKKSTFLTTTHRDSITILGDEKATLDDATWLYVDTKDNNKIKDIYGHDGTPSNPFTIKTADELLSFAYEVKGTNRTKAVSYYNVITQQNATILVNGSFDFTGYYIKLDADITMPKETTTKDVTWIGIGESGKNFNGVFLGESRYINNLYGQPFFNEVGGYAVVDKVNFANIINVTGTGVVANVNNGLICGCNVEGNVTQANPGTNNSYCGSIVGDNKSFIVACTHVGNVAGYGYVGGLVGHNAGALVASYHAGLVSYGTDATDAQKQGIGGSTGLKDTKKSIVFSCYQNGDLIEHEPNLLKYRAAWPLTTAQMQSNAFVNSDSENIFGVGTDHPAFADSDDDNEENPYKVYIAGADKHYSLNIALQEFSKWVQAKANTNEPVVLPCHSFSAAQVKTLNGLFSKSVGGELAPAHLYKYVPGTYPRVQ